MMFEFIEIRTFKEDFDIRGFFQVLEEPENYKDYKISMDLNFNEWILNISKNNESDFKKYNSFKFILEKINEKNLKIEFLTYYIAKYDLFLLNVDVYNKEKLILLNYLNEKFRKEYYFKSLSPKRKDIWKVLEKEHSIDLEIYNEKGDIIDYENFYNNKEIINNIKNYQIYSSLLSLNIRNKKNVITLYGGNRIDIPEDFNFSHTIDLIDKFKVLLKK